jgi:peptide/nickel transport system permease protein
MSKKSNAKMLVSKKYKKRSNFGDIFHRIRKNKGATVGLCIIGALVLTLLISLFISYASITVTNISNRFQHPSAQHLFGTDAMGRDVFLRTIYGTRYSLAIGFGASLFAAIIGVFVGSISGFYGGILDDIIMRLTDVLASIPGLLLGMVIVSVMGGSLLNLLLAVGICSVQYYIRITRASIISIRGQEYVEAARAIGMSNIKIIFTQVLPNGLSPIIVMFSGTLGIAILVAAGLSFLGLGIPVPQPEWGALISDGRNYIRTASYLSTFPGLFIMITVLAFNLVGDGLRDALDPKLKR